MTDGPDVPFEETEIRTHCERYGHVWRYEDHSGQRLRVCVECGLIQFPANGGWA